MNLPANTLPRHANKKNNRRQGRMQAVSDVNIVLGRSSGSSTLMAVRRGPSAHWKSPAWPSSAGRSAPSRSIMSVCSLERKHTTLGSQRRTYWKVLNCVEPMYHTAQLLMSSNVNAQETLLAI
eukprot:scaffold86775_cov19-Prasinocladus_malaysianus.AAC.1